MCAERGRREHARRAIRAPSVGVAWSRSTSRIVARYSGRTSDSAKTKFVVNSTAGDSEMSIATTVASTGRQRGESTSQRVRAGPRRQRSEHGVERERDVEHRGRVVGEPMGRREQRAEQRPPDAVVVHVPPSPAAEVAGDCELGGLVGPDRVLVAAPRSPQPDAECHRGTRARPLTPTRRRSTPGATLEIGSINRGVRLQCRDLDLDLHPRIGEADHEHGRRRPGDHRSIGAATANTARSRRVSGT